MMERAKNPVKVTSSQNHALNQYNSFKTKTKARKVYWTLADMGLQILGKYALF